ncbi:MAG: hypothetical protein WC889_12985 [Myxococcota bacterium]|jgi:hypothetical protein
MTHLNSNSRWNIIELLVKGAASVAMLSIILFSFTSHAAENDDNWAIDPADTLVRPGDELRMYAKGFGYGSIGLLALGGITFAAAYGSDSFDAKWVFGWTFLVSTGVGVVSGLAALIFWGGAAYKDANPGETERLAPYMAPILGKKDDSGSRVAFEGAVVGLKGTF